MGRKKEFTGIWIPREIWEDDRLGIYDKVVYAVISGLAHGEGGCFATNPRLAEYCKFSERQISKSITMLSRLGYLRIENAGTPVRRIYAEPRTTCAVTTHDVRDNHAPCARSERTMCAVTTHDVRGSDENLPIIYNYNNNYNNIYNNACEKAPTIEDVKAFISERKSPVDPVRFYEYYDLAKWRDKDGNFINWMQKVILWESSERPKDHAAGFAGGSFETDEFMTAALAAANDNDAADDGLPWEI